MIIKTLVENTTISQKFKGEHGLSLYIETKKHKLLFDTGASTLFIENAEKLGVELADIDIVVISHGHSDHGGGLKAFLELNSKAKIYLNKNAFGSHFANRPMGKKTYIGLDQGLIPNSRFIFVGDYLRIDEELELFSNIKGKKLISKGNENLFMKSGLSYVQDNFDHEQNLIIKEDGKRLLIAGCAHKGIVNIVDQFIEHENAQPDYVIGGFHLYSPSLNTSVGAPFLDNIGEYLKNTSSTFYTCHCTGIEPYETLKETMGEKIHYLATGSSLII